jgi:hypothetical protein
LVIDIAICFETAQRRGLNAKSLAQHALKWGALGAAAAKANAKPNGKAPWEPRARPGCTSHSSRCPL